VAAASTVVVMWNPTKIFIASDSKVTVSSGVSGVIGSYPECKVHSGGDCCVSAAQGTLQLGQQWKIWNVLDYVAAHSNSVEEAATLSQDRLKTSFSLVAHNYRGVLALDRVYFSWIIAGVRSNGQTVVFRGYIPASEDHKIEPKGQTFVALSGEVRFLCLGKCEAVEAYQKSNPEWENGQYGEIVKRLVQIEIDALPDEVGPPISLTVISKKGGVEWRSCGACEENKQCESDGRKELKP